MSRPEGDLYELLEVSRSATSEEIERAYRLAMETYGEGSLAGYSVVSEGESTDLRERIQEAYRVLSQESSRRAYDASLAVAESEPAMEPAPAEVPEPASEPFVELDEGESEWSGARLRRYRLHRDLELEEVATVTKINPTYLRFIEEERFHDLPARVYVRGFVAAYARCIGLDGDSVSASYLVRYEEARRSPGRVRT